jgi:hypothetical protein
MSDSPHTLSPGPPEYRARHQRPLCQISAESRRSVYGQLRALRLTRRKCPSLVAES